MYISSSVLKRFASLIICNIEYDHMNFNIYLTLCSILLV